MSVVQLLARYDQIECLDSTHNTCVSREEKKENGFLYTIVVKNLATGRGVPAAFVIITSETQYPIIQWLRWLSFRLDFRPQNWMIDCSDTEIAAIRSVYGQDASIFVCHWHVLQAVVKQSKEKLKIKESSATSNRSQKAEANKELRNKAVRDFIKIMNSETPEVFQEEWNRVIQAFSEHRDWVCYLTGQWLHKKEQWCICWRKVSQTFLAANLRLTRDIRRIVLITMSTQTT